ncbi:WD40 repeat-like protein [Suhomyces tanzawaensis NRRL Y-17324]|uniref:Protein transport protein SEC31 n=1 Tax=Suhomyces tanzawaensis NRRL Y-17324 TaxID=984487 RepID=A0A1E4SDS4_9ASCO|nr:WD40 repeat-like protein [Suhomyces tanzawaensis NRRL Y-17324]ODV77633.1 WD40 repeat-like protein [Suhomyces tanzawaensis NRRL Y-17324]
MVKINEIARTSTFAWSLDSLPLLATGTVAGAVDVDFSSSASLEVWDTFSATNKNDPIFSAPVENRFYALAWSKPFEGRPKGLLAGAFENGVIEFWDAEILIKSKDLKKASVHKSHKHSGPVKSLQFSPSQDHVMVSGGAQGQIFIWDTKVFSEPFSPGQAMTPMDDVTSVAWNNSISHIIASTGSNGYTSIWDLKSKREVLHLSYSGPSGRANFSHVAWHPTQSTKLITASDNDSCPLILTWDLRNSNEPEKILEGHKKGVLSLDWCKQDPNLLISSGKDNTTFLWNPITAEKLGEYPTTANWAFQTGFAPAVPDIFATASFDGKIIIQSLQDTSPPVSTKVTSNDDNVFWNQISTTETQQPVFQIKQAPEWLKRPSSVSFGFGSKIVQVKKDESGKSIINILKFVSKSQGGSSKLYEALRGDDYKTIINSKLEATVDNVNDKADWELLKKLSETGREEILKHEITEKSEIKAEETKEDEEESNENQDSFFEKLGNGSIAPVEDAFSPSGSFQLIDPKEPEDNKKIIKAILNNKVEDAVSLCLEQDRIIEALILALDSSDSIKQKVKNSYFKKNEKKEFTRVLFNVSNKNISDIVANADVANWKEIASSIIAFSTDESDRNAKVSELGDRLLKSGDSKEQRDNAITCYLAGNALDKIANIWLKELPAFESELLKSESFSNITSPAEARLESLSNFVLKIVAYRSISHDSGVLSGPSVEPISKAILEYANLVAGYGEFELAEKFLTILPSEFAGTEKERISKASGKVETKSLINKSAAAKTQPRNAYSRTGGVPAAEPAYGRQPNAPGVPTIPSAQSIAPAVKPFVPQQPTGVAKPTSNPYARAATSNPYAPQGSSNPYAPSAPASSVPAAVPPPGATVTPPPLAPTNSYKKDTEGWNDLPDTFKPKAAARRAAPAVVSQPTTPFAPSPQATPGPPTRGSIGTAAPGPTAVPPPPRVASRTGSKASIATPPMVNSPRQSSVQLNSRYAPPPGAAPEIAPPVNNGFATSAPPVGSSPAVPKKNPYAPAESNFASPSKVAYAPPPTGNLVPPNGVSSPGIPRAPVTAPPKNPYAPPPAANAPKFPVQGGNVPPPPKAGGIPPPQPFGSISAPPIQPAFNSVPPPPRTPSIGQQPPAAPPVSYQQAPVAPEPAKPKHPSGDRSHIPENSLPIYEDFSRILEAIKPNIPEKFAKHGQDMETRLNILFDHLNNEELLSNATIEQLKEIASALDARDFPKAASLNVDVATNHADELGTWHTGVKRLITMAEVMY